MKNKKLLSGLIVALYLIAGSSFPYGSQSVFYLGTDKSFGLDEKPYVNLEGEGNNTYHFRVYEIEDPVKFLNEKVKRRLAAENSDKAFGDPVAIFESTWSIYKKEFRKLARKEMNVKTRSQIKNSAGIDFEAGSEKYLAIPKVLENHRLLTSFEITETGTDWFYKRVPIPVSNAGFYLVEVYNRSNVGYTVVVKSNLTFVTKQSDMETLIYAAQKDTGKPVSGADVIMMNPDTLAMDHSGKTSSSGTLYLRQPTSVMSVIALKKGNEIAVSDPQFYANSFYGKGGKRAFIFTDRPVYKPGDEVLFKGILRNFHDASYKISDGNGYCDVVSGDGKTILSGIPVSISSDYGSFSGSFSVPVGDSVYKGMYTLVLHYNGEAFATDFKVDVYKKPTFNVKVTTEKAVYIQGEEISAQVSANFYYGAPVSGAKVKYSIFRKARYTYSPVGTLFAGELAKSYLGLEGPLNAELESEGEGLLDSFGRFDLKFKPGKSDEDSIYSINVFVTDKSGATIMGQKSVPVNRGEFYIIISRENMIYSPGDKVAMEVALEPFEKSQEPDKIKKIVGSRELTMELFQREFVHISAEKSLKSILKKSYITNEMGKGKLEFTIPEHGHYFVKVSTEDSNGKEITSETTLWVSGKSDSIQVPFKNLTLKTSKDIYSVGDLAEILIMSPVSDGKLLVTQEGNSILKYETISMNGNTYKYQVRVTEEMVPNFTVSAVQFSGGEIYKSDIKVVAPPVNKLLSVNVKSDRSVYTPGDTVSLDIQTLDYRKKGTPSELTVSVVDEAIYQIEPDRNPSLLSFFYHPRRNNVQTTLSSSYRFFGYSEDKRLKLALKKGRNSAMAQVKDQQESRRETFKDTAFWTAKVKTDSDGKARIQFSLPSNLTTWRINVTAVTTDTSVGEKKIKVISKKDVMLISNLPSFIYNNSSQVVGVNAVNTTPNPVDVSVNMELKNAKAKGETQKKIHLDGNETKPIYFTVEGNDSGDFAEIVFNLTSPKFTDSLKEKIDLVPYGVEKKDTRVVKMDSGSQVSEKEFKIEKNFIHPSMTIHLSPGYGETVKESLAYLAGYPYGCIEQTMSRFMPLLAAKKAGFISVYLKNRLPDMVKTGFKQIRNLQNSDGGFGWYTQADKLESDPLMTAYVYRGLALSKKLGENPDAYVMNRTRMYLYNFLSNKEHSVYLKVYILYSLSEGGKLESSMVKSLNESVLKESAYAMALASLVLQANGQIEEARDLFQKAYSKNQKSVQSTLHFADIKTGNIEDDLVETTSALLTAAVRLDMDKSILDNLSQILIMNRYGLAWKNSRDTSSAVLALSEVLERFGEKSSGVQMEVLVNNRPVKTIQVSGTSIHQGEYVLNIDGEYLKQGSNNIQFRKLNGPEIYVMTSLDYFDGSENISAADTGFSVKRSYYVVQSERTSGGLKLKASKTDAFQPGDIVMVEIQIERKSAADIYVEVDDSLIPGFSVLKNDTEYYNSDFPLEYNQRQVSKDHISFFTALYQSKMTVRYFLTADLPGNYKSSPATAELMYFPEISGNSSGQTVTIKERL